MLTDPSMLDWQLYLVPEIEQSCRKKFALRKPLGRQKDQCQDKNRSELGNSEMGRQDRLERSLLWSRDDKLYVASTWLRKLRNDMAIPVPEATIRPNTRSRLPEPFLEAMVTRREAPRMAISVWMPMWP